MAASEGWRSFFRTELEVLLQLRERLLARHVRATTAPTPAAPAEALPAPRAWRRGRAPRRRAPSPPTLARRARAALRRLPALALSLAVHAGLLSILAAATWAVLDDREAYVRIRFLRDLPHTASLPRREDTASPDEPAQPQPPATVALEPRPDPVQGAPEAPPDPSLRDRADRTSEDLTGVGATGRPVLGRRDAGARERALARYGGDEASEGAVQAALAWLARHQASEGGFEAEGFQRRCVEPGACWGPGRAHHDTGVTGLALLAFLGAGHTDRQGSHAEAVGRALARTLALQRPDGCYDPMEPGDLYNHGIATLAVTEAYAMTGEARYAASARRALAYLASAQQRGGGWDYTAAPTGRNDLSVTGWQVMALRSARLAGLAVPEEVLSGARRFLASATRSTGEGIYADRGVGEGREGVGMVAVSLLSRLYLGWEAGGATSQRQVSQLLRNLPDWERMEKGQGFQTLYYWYYGSLSLFHVGGEAWERWNSATRDLLVARQRQGGEADGSWDPSGQWIGRVGGRVYATAINAMTLEVYYRYLPLFEGDADLDPVEDLDSALGVAVTAPDPADRLRALESFPKSGDPRVLRALDQALEDPDGRVRDAARDRLVAIGGTEVVPPLARGLASEDLTRRWQSVKALAAVRGPEAAAALAKALADPALGPLVPSVLEALGACGDAASVDVILPWLNHDDPAVAAAARSALARLRPESDSDDHP